MTTFGTFKRAWNLAASLLLLRPWWAGEDLGVAIVCWIFAAACGYAVIYLGVNMVSTASPEPGRRNVSGTRSSRPAVLQDAGSIPAASTTHPNRRES